MNFLVFVQKKQLTFILKQLYVCRSFLVVTHQGINRARQKTVSHSLMHIGKQM